MSVDTRCTENATHSVARSFIDLFLISFLILFFELACIRWFASCVIFLTFFTNLVLMACFLGMSIGCLIAAKKRSYLGLVNPLALAGVVLPWLVAWSFRHFGRVMVGVGDQSSPQQIFFGTEYRPRDPSFFVVPIEAIAAVFYVLIALMFVGLGQVMGRAFDRLPNRVAAYTINVLGSLIGIVAFGLASYLRTPPIVWYATALAIVFYFLPSKSLLQVLCALGTLMVIGFMAQRENTRNQILWSPYYKVSYRIQSGEINTNNIGHQAMVNVHETAPAYVLPHLLNRDAGRPPFGDVLIIGAGSGNDVTAALAHGARHVDAVEIDPLINEIGRADHPNHPYDDPRVSIHLDDGRSFVRKTDRTYDLVVYALVDSLVLHSGYASLRLESFLFTEQAFRDIKAKLKPDGVFVMCNFYRQGWVVGRLEKMAESIFGAKPIVISLPYLDRISPSDNQSGRFTFLIAGAPDAPDLVAIRKALRDRGAFWINKRPARNEALNAYGPTPPAVPDAPADSWQKIGESVVDTAEIRLVPTDDWPFLYLREAALPDLNVRWMIVVGVLSVALLFCLASPRTLRPNGQMFFLGAGFMLLETKGVVHMALLFGSTWVVNCVVFGAILVMILLANLFVLAVQPRRLGLFYALLVASLLANALIPMDTFLALPGAARILASCAIVFVPVFFAGVIFAVAFRESRQPDVDFGSNVGGVILGGLSEFFSMVLGFNHLILIAVAFYLMSTVLRPRALWVQALAAQPGGALS